MTDGTTTNGTTSNGTTTNETTTKGIKTKGIKTKGIKTKGIKTKGIKTKGIKTKGIMTNVVIECILSRSSTKYYDPAATLSDDQIRELVRIGTTAPTSFHLQNWRFIAVRSPKAKVRLRPIAWNQPAITEAAVTFIVCGQLADSSVVPQRLAPVVEAGIMPANMVPEWEIPARNLYMEYPQRQRDEAVRTGTFGAAAMIYAARSLGLGSTPMIGFDAEAVHREFGLAANELPVMLLSVGPERPGNWPQKPRLPVVDVLDLV